MLIVQSSDFGRFKLTLEADSLCFSVILSGDSPRSFPKKSEALSRFLDLMKELLVIKRDGVKVSLYIILAQSSIFCLFFSTLKRMSDSGKQKAFYFKKN